MSLTKFRSTEKELIEKYYKENGYVIISNLIEGSKIDEFILEYEKFKNRKNYLFNAQDTNRPEKLKINKNGFIENSIMDPLDLTFAGEFPKLAKRVILNDSVSNALQSINNKENNVHWQSMFFDKSTGTVIHQDSYYLDSDPCGQLIGAWYALEDINPDAGCFYIVPKSHEIGKALHKEKEHDAYVKSMLNYAEKEHVTKLPCPLEKGDVLFWNSLTLHGSFENVDPQYSRKSFTSHFIPKGIKRDPDTNTEIMPSNVKGIYIRKKNIFKEKLRYMKVYLKYVILNKLLNKVSMEMKSEKY